MRESGGTLRFKAVVCSEDCWLGKKNGGTCRHTPGISAASQIACTARARPLHLDLHTGNKHMYQIHAVITLF